MLVLPKLITKRDGVTKQKFDHNKIKKVIVAACSSVGDVEGKTIDKIVNDVVKCIPEDNVDVETIQDVVETSLMRNKLFAVAKAYILYRHKKHELREVRLRATDPKGLADYIHAGKYARYLPNKHRRETYEETVARVEKMHCKKFPELKDDVTEAFDFVRAKKVLPSMRSMQFAGVAVEKNNNRQYNCSFTLVDRFDAFHEALFLLLSGCGVGYSIQFDHVERLPEIGTINRKAVVHHVIEDSIEGWSDALKALFVSFQEGHNLEFSYHKIRAAGKPLKTSGGKAPGHLQLKESLERIRSVLLAAQGRQLRPIECHRIMCHLADAVLSGGIRRSAMIALFSLEDSEMVYAKTGNWWDNDPWFANANNSVVLKRDEVKKKQFKRIFEMCKQWGEPGFFFTNDYDYGTNPCGEVALYPKLKVTKKVKDKLLERGISHKVGEFVTGWAFCNLCEINAAKFESYEDFEKAAKAATLIGTLQATYTHFDYLGPVSELITERDALLGVSMTGMLDVPDISCNPDYQKTVAEKVKKWNREYADLLGIRPAARTTVVKPAGTTSLELGCVGSGHHAHHARRYIRRVTADELEQVFQEFKKVNPHMCVRKPDGKWVIEFPVQAPDKAIVKGDLGAIEFLKMVISTQQNWVIPGNASSPDLNHNVSNTVIVKPDEWDAVCEYIWKNRELFTGVSLLPASGDKDYPFAPMEAIITAADEKRWNDIVCNYKPIDYSKLHEEEDTTNLTGEVACAGGFCEIQ